MDPSFGFISRPADSGDDTLAEIAEAIGDLIFTVEYSVALETWDFAWLERPQTLSFANLGYCSGNVFTVLISIPTDTARCIS